MELKFIFYAPKADLDVLSLRRRAVGLEATGRAARAANQPAVGKPARPGAVKKQKRLCVFLKRSYLVVKQPNKAKF